MAFKITCTEFKEGQPIPRKFTCEGADVSPPLSWEDAPDGTTSFTLIVNDPDAPAGDWVHWVLYNLSAETHHLAEGIPSEKSLLDGALQGRNSWHQVRYGGPCPPPSGIHHYYFRLYALDCKLTLDGGANKQEVTYAMQGHILAQTQLIGIFSRNQNNF
jgi:Raf kinase inhibitor-like YbhB/YbcL family protein